jgi:hypothetical protein
VGTSATLQGTVVEQSNPGTPIAGAAISVGGSTATSDASGAFQVVLPAGAVTLLVSKPGYAVHREALQLVAGQPLTVQVALALTSVDQPPVLEVSSPLSGGSVDLSRVVLVGSAVDDSGPLSSLQLVQNAGAAVTVPVVAGAFQAALQLAPGLNTLELSVTDVAGHTTTLTWTASFRAGFSGLVHRFDDASAIVVDAELTLLDPDTQVSLGTTRSGADGRYELAATGAGMKRLHVVKAGFMPRDLLVDVSADERTTLDVGLTPGDVVELRFLEPSSEGPFEVEELTVSGVVTGFELVSVTVNGVPATLLGSGFVAKVPLPEGRTELQAIAEGSGGQSVRGSVTVLRPMGAVTGGCSSSALGAWLLGALLLCRRPRARARFTTSGRSDASSAPPAH